MDNWFYKKNAQKPYQEDTGAALRRRAQGCRNPKALLEMAKEHFNNEVVCFYISENRYSDNEVLTILARQPHRLVRRQVASGSHKITDFETLVLLSEDKDPIVRENLARTVLNEQILYKLFRENFKRPEIAGSFLKRTSNPEFLRNFIQQATPNVLNRFSYQILSNKNLAEEDLNELIRKNCISIVPILSSFALTEVSLDILSKKLLVFPFDSLSDDELICLASTSKINWEKHLELLTKLYLYASKKKNSRGARILPYLEQHTL